jgi:hypothetical protein
VSASAVGIGEFLALPEEQALGVVLRYKTFLLKAGLAPSKIDMRLSALESLVDQLGRGRVRSVRSIWLWRR